MCEDYERDETILFEMHDAQRQRSGLRDTRCISFHPVKLDMEKNLREFLQLSRQTLKVPEGGGELQ